MATKRKKTKKRPSTRPSNAGPGKLELEFCTALVVSTAHITQEDAELLDRVDGNGEGNEIWSFKGKHGWFVYVDEGLNGVIHEFSKAFLKLLEFTKKQGCWWIRLDADGPEIEGLKKFEW